MNKNNIRSRVIGLLHKITANKKRFVCVILAVILLILIVAVLIFMVISHANILPVKRQGFVEVTHSNTASRISVTTTKLYIKEWNIEAPVNGNILGSLTYRINSDNSKIIFVSPKLDEANFSSDECVKAGVTKESWGISRAVKKNSYPAGKYPITIGNYEYTRFFPDSVCEASKDIDSAFNYLTLYLAERQ